MGQSRTLVRNSSTKEGGLAFVGTASAVALACCRWHKERGQRCLDILPLGICLQRLFAALFPCPDEFFFRAGNVWALACVAVFASFDAAIKVVQ